MDGERQVQAGHGVEDRIENGIVDRNATPVAERDAQAEVLRDLHAAHAHLFRALELRHLALGPVRLADPFEVDVREDDVVAARQSRHRDRVFESLARDAAREVDDASDPL
jgi:hypothetical protein